jgi:hypothetical protein
MESTSAVYQNISTTPALDKLNAFVGKWKITGKQFEGPFGPAAEINTEESWEWLPGGLFLIHRLTGNVGEQPIACIEIIGYDEKNTNYQMHSFYNDGKTNKWQTNENNGTWILTGNSEAAGKLIKIRCTTKFSNNNNAIAVKWEKCDDGQEWETFWETNATKILFF